MRCRRSLWSLTLCGALAGRVLVPFAFPYGNPEPQETWREQIAAHYAEGDWDAAEHVLRDAIDRDATDPGPQLALAAHLTSVGEAWLSEDDLSQHLGEGQLREALAWSSPWVDHAAVGYDASWSTARTLQGLGRFDEAADALTKAAEHAGDDPERSASLERAWILLWNVAERTDARDARLTEAEQAGRLDAAEAAGWRLEFAAAALDAEAAIQHATAALELGGDAFALGGRVWDAHAPGPDLYERLLFAYSQLVAANPDRAGLRFYRGVARLYGKDPAGAELDLRSCLDDPSISLRARHFHGRALLALGRLEEACAAFRAVLAGDGALAGDSLLGLLDAAARHGIANRHDQARAIYEEVLESEPVNSWARIGLPLCFKGVDDVAGAERAYLAGLEALPNHPQLLNDLALLLRGDGREGEARQWFERAHAAGSLDATENLGVIAFGEERAFDVAADRFADVLRVEPDRAKSRFYRELSLSAAGADGRSSPGGR